MVMHSSASVRQRRFRMRQRVTIAKDVETF
jgi:hypothetical protein